MKLLKLYPVVVCRWYIFVTKEGASEVSALQPSRLTMDGANVQCKLKFAGHGHFHSPP